MNVQVDGETLDGWVYAPAAAGRHPAVVFIHGAGTKHRDGFDEQASYLARSGIVSLVLDKRTVGYSTWQRDYEAMAADTLAGVDLLRRR
ncbi:MAG: alpha/beta hydrolase, partial [Actinobacteria bacterium]|nr:alpha/beta hydrolase [Actinomycetota bacterium]NIS33373.1 alpha/beta hydrolase [Actinomycetota bacterium]NIW30072.1 alpha/beta hydrolase [Actinomycetota bacterium]